MKEGLGKTIELPRMFGPQMHEDPYPVYQAVVPVTTLFTELGTLELVPAEWRHRENFNMRCYETLPIRLAK